MLRRIFSSASNLGSKKNVVSIILIGNALVWYYSVLSTLDSTNPSIFVWVVHFSALILSALAGASFAKQIERSRFLIIWMILGIIASMMLVGLNSSSEILVGFESLFLGLSLGFGMPVCMSYFTVSVPVESRGRVSGLAMLVSGIGIVAFGFVEVSDLLLVGLILAVWRLSCLLIFLWAKDYRRIQRKESVVSYRVVLSQHSFILYFVPWIMFSFVNYLAVPMAPSYGGYLNIDTVQMVCLGGAAVLGGFFVDSIGRKRIAITGFAMLGVGTAVLGFSGNNFQGIPPVILYLNSVIDGIAWGFLLVLFVLTLWGDLSYSSSSEKYYALGVMPFFVSKLLELTAGPYILEGITTSTTALFSFTAFFLFLAVLPLFYAPETLPEKALKDRDLKSYVEKAQKQVSKISKKKLENRKSSDPTFQVIQNDEEQSDEYNRARELAEKYY